MLAETGTLGAGPVDVRTGGLGPAGPVGETGVEVTGVDGPAFAVPGPGGGVVAGVVLVPPLGRGRAVK